MTNTPSKEKYVTEDVFKKEVNGIHEEFSRVHQKIDTDVKGLHEKIDSSIDRLDKKIDTSTSRLGHELIKTNERLERVENTMATKTDLNQLYDRIDHLFKKNSLFEQEEGVQSLHLTEVRRTVTDHETRLMKLESPR